jgi:hypothetical protein
MRSTAVIGLVLIVVGLASLLSQGFSYTKREKVLDIGPLQATATTRHTLPIPPLVGGLALAAGVALVIAGSRRAS